MGLVAQFGSSLDSWFPEHKLRSDEVVEFRSNSRSEKKHPPLDMGVTAQGAIFVHAVQLLSVRVSR